MQIYVTNAVFRLGSWWLPASLSVFLRSVRDKCRLTFETYPHMVNKWSVLTVVTVNQYWSLFNLWLLCHTVFADELCKSQFYFFNGDSLRLNLWTDKDVQLWTETEHDLLRLIHKTYITILMIVRKTSRTKCNFKEKMICLSRILSTVNKM